MNARRLFRFPALLAALALLLCAGGVARAASDWQVVKVGRWDYLTVDNIAKFYGFPPPGPPVNNSIRLDNGRIQLEVALNNREAIVNGVRNWLCFPVIQHTDGRFLISRIDLAKTLEPQFRPHMIGNLGKFTTVVIDPGHGGIEQGAASSFGHEKEFTLDVARQLKPLLEAKGLHVVMTRDSDQQVPLPERARIANSTRDCIFVSIHFNATDTNSAANGFEIYSLSPRGAPSTQDNMLMAHFANPQNGTPVDAASLALSTSVYHSMLAYMPEFDRGIKRARFAVLRLTQVPAILVEGGFLTERQESREIANPEWRGKLAHAIAVGIENYRGLVEKKKRPMLLADYRRQSQGALVARDASAPTISPTSEVQPASNTQQPMGALARLTNALRREPGGQSTTHAGDGDDTTESGSSNAPASVAVSPVPPAPVPTEPDPLQNVAGAPHAEVLAAAADTTAMPSSPATTPEPAIGAETSNPPAPEPIAEETAAAVAAASPAPSPLPPPPSVRKYWVLKFDPPPKFRQ
ncbi:MAG: N-acetylmuramoyl-L-alanine amidase [Verrucomicrobiota bacterium]|nr:N-acetylmuramoyl-L-alanine amidase [Verrucomicrobiota bacterium]